MTVAVEILTGNVASERGQAVASVVLVATGTALAEAAKPDAVLDMTPEELFPALHRAQMRLQLYVAGRVHALLLDVGAAAREALSDAAGPEGTLDGLGLNLAQERLTAVWRTFITQYRVLFEDARQETVALAFGALPVLHRHFFGQVLEEGRYLASLQEDAISMGGIAFYRPQLEAVLKAADERLYGDGFRLSQRIWRLDEEGLAGIRGALYAGVADGKSAFQIAKNVEQYLGAGQECPRWTRYRLYGLTKKQIAQGRKGGLYSGAECAEQGVAYKALRLARTELQYVHHLAGQHIRQQMPFVEGEQIVLSPAHPRRDICDEIIEAAPNGDGVYPVGEIQLPIHPNCLCDGRAVLMEEDAFVGRLGGWLDGTGPWTEMDTYANWVGMETRTFTSPYLQGMELAFQLWFLGNEEDHEGRIVEAA